MIDLESIQERLKKASEGPWKAVEAGSIVINPHIETPHDKSECEDDSILREDNTEVLGTSEWLRCEWDDLEFMAHARKDVEDLLKQVYIFEEFKEYLRRLDTISRNNTSDAIYHDLKKKIKSLEEKYK